jgi:hypothetical protein
VSIFLTWIVIGMILVTSRCKQQRIDALEKHVAAHDEHLEALEKRLSTPENGSRKTMSNDQVKPDKATLKTGDIIRYNVGPASTDELGRDMTVVSSLKNQQLDPCLFTRQNETITVLDVRGEYAFVEYESPDTERVAAADKARGISSRIAYCASGDIGIISVEALKAHAWLSGAYLKDRRVQREEVARIRKMFSDLLPTEQAEGI